MRIIFIPKYDFDYETIKKQLHVFGRDDIFVFTRNQYLEQENDIIEYDVIPNKQNALLLDFGGNLERHGPIDKIKGDDKKEGRGGDAPRKQCPKCFEAVFASARFCPCCNYEFQFDESIKIEAIASNAAVLSIQLDKEQKKMEQRAAKSIEDLIKLGYKRGYKNPTYWAQCIMKARKK